ncbi:MAG: CAP domain-containing protein [Ilumatobacteraceae bacterium]
MHRLRSPRPPARLGAWGVTAVLALTGINSLNANGSGAAAGAPAKRLQIPTTTVAPVDDVAATVVALTNQARAEAGVAPVVEDGRLDAAAGAHSADQAARSTMTHTGADGSNPGQRMTAAGFKWQTWGENVAAGQTSAAQVVQAWLNSPGHRTNMLNGAYSSIGIGVATGPNGVLYWTMDLAG